MPFGVNLHVRTAQVHPSECYWVLRRVGRSLPVQMADRDKEEVELCLCVR